MDASSRESLKNVAYAAKLLRLQEERYRQTGPGGLMHFIRYFWRVLEPGREFVDGWALHAVAEHLEAVERGKLNRLLITIPPGFMKSLMTNVWFMCWLWGPQSKPYLRSLSFSYAAHLTERDNEKCRTLISSRPYQELWGDRFKLTSDSKIKISNDHQGWLLASSVGGVSTGERGDIIRCFPYNELVATENGAIPIGEIVSKRLPVRVWSTNLDTGEASLQPIADWKANPGSSLVKVTFSDGSSLRCTPDHRIWTSAGWKPAVALQASDVIPCTPVFDIGDSLARNAVFSTDSPQGDPLSVEYLKNGSLIESRYSLRARFFEFAAAIPNSLNLLWGYAVLRRNLLFCRGFLGKDGIKCGLVEGYYSGRGALSGSLSLNGKIKRAPSSPEADIHNSASAYSISLGQISQKCIGLFCNLSNNLLRKAWRAIFESSMFFAISDILRSGPVGQVIKSWVGSLTVAVSDFHAFWARAKESISYHFMAEPIYSFAAQSQSNAGISFIEAGSKQSTFEFLQFSPVVDSSRQATNSSKARDFVKPFATNYGAPDFVRVVSVENFGHVDETFCLTIPNNHTFYVQCQAECGNGHKILVANCDDPHNAIQGESERVRNETVRWFKESMSNRVNDPEKSAIVVVHQRLNESDVAGSIIEDSEGMGYEHLCIPMRFEIDGPWSKSTKIGWEDPRMYDGELAWPERFPAKVVDDLERDLGPFGFAGQYQQNPSPRGGGIIKRNWFRLWEHPQNKFPPFENVVAAVDPAYTEKDENDPSAMAIFATFRHPESNEFGIMLVHCWRKRLTIHGDTSPRFPGESAKAYERRVGDNWGLVEWIWHCCDTYGVQQLFIEGKASGISVFQEIERRQSLRPWACEIDTGKGGGDKVARLTAVQPLFSQGLIWAPDRDWADMYINELSSFPKGKYDDLCDVTSLGLRKLREMGLIQHTDEREYEEYYENNRPQALEPLYPV